jgi:hypothetical protein
VALYAKDNQCFSLLSLYQAEDDVILRESVSVIWEGVKFLMVTERGGSIPYSWMAICGGVCHNGLWCQVRS